MIDRSRGNCHVVEIADDRHFGRMLRIGRSHDEKQTPSPSEWRSYVERPYSGSW